jgi:hypothetical protein
LDGIKLELVSNFAKEFEDVALTVAVVAAAFVAVFSFGDKEVVVAELLVAEAMVAETAAPVPVTD